MSRNRNVDDNDNPALLKKNSISDKKPDRIVDNRNKTPVWDRYEHSNIS